MTDSKLNIALLAGGNSSEREIALQSAAQVAENFDHERYNVWLVDLKGRQMTYTDTESGKPYNVDLNTFSLSIEGREVVFDYAFIIIHGTPGEDGHLQGYLEMMGVPFSSCDMTSSVLTFDKAACKRAVAEAGVELARGVMINDGDWIAPEAIVAELGLPLFVKPNASGSSYGVTKVKSPEELPEAIYKAMEESPQVLVEECIVGREMACGVLVTAEKEYLLPVTEIVAKNEFFDYEAKYTPGMSDEITPAELPEEVAAQLQSLALTAYKACRCKGLCRVDFIITPSGKPYMIEINSIPGMSAGSIVPKQLRAAGLTMKEILTAIVEDTKNC